MRKTIEKTVQKVSRADQRTNELDAEKRELFEKTLASE